MSDGNSTRICIATDDNVHVRTESTKVDPVDGDITAFVRCVGNAVNAGRVVAVSGDCMDDVSRKHFEVQ